MVIELDRYALNASNRLRLTQFFRRAVPSVNLVRFESELFAVWDLKAVIRPHLCFGKVRNFDVQVAVVVDPPIRL